MTESGTYDTAFRADGTAGCGDITVEFDPETGQIRLTAETSRVKRILLVWPVHQRDDIHRSLYLADHWERSYGDLEWRALRADRVMPWYFLQHAPDGRTHGYGVKVRPAALCFWRMSREELILGCDVRCGGTGVDLRGRTLAVCTVVLREGPEHETPFEAAISFTRLLCDDPLLPDHAVYGGNDWYYLYGANSAETVLRDAGTISELSPNTNNRPYSVIDAGWSITEGSCPGGPWLPNANFPGFHQLPARMRDLGTRPGIWVRPTATSLDSLPGLQRPKAGGDKKTRLIDISTDEVQADMSRYLGHLVNDLGFELIKHDFSSWDVFGKPGYHFHDRITDDGWAFADTTRTTAEILIAHYRNLLTSSGPATVLACNCPGHLTAGLCHINRTGGDTSGLNWERTRIQGVNTLAFRMPQHGALYAIDGDCVGLTPNIPWSMNREWLQLLAHSGTPLFVSLQPEALGPDQESALREAFDIASRPLPMAEPLDWITNTTPNEWRCHDGEHRFRWNGFPGEDFTTDVILYQ
jgi:alpha-galactosidase